MKIRHYSHNVGSEVSPREFCKFGLSVRLARPPGLPISSVAQRDVVAQRPTLTDLISDYANNSLQPCLPFLEKKRAC